MNGIDDEALPWLMMHGDGNWQRAIRRHDAATPIFSSLTEKRADNVLRVEL